MNLFINPKITIKEPVKNKNFGYFTAIDEKDKTVLKIKSKSFNGRSRGIVGSITREGEIQAESKVAALFTKEIKKKVDFVLDMAFGEKRNSYELKAERGLVVR